jgi:hypothetical protein
MKKLFSAMLVIFAVQISFAQQIYPIKESYDQILEPRYTEPGIAYDYNNTSTPWWETWGWNLLLYLRMYETTHDKAYLNKFNRHKA